MTTIAIIEGNTPEVIAKSDSGAAGFVRTLLALAPNVELRVAAPYAGPVSAEVLEGADGVVFTGSGVAWSASGPEIASHAAIMELSFAAGLPVWGSCNGMQLAAVVLGGHVDASPLGLEVGFARDIEVTDAGQTHPMMAGRRDPFAASTFHRDEVQRIPDGAVVLANNRHCAVQAMVYERDAVAFWGTQYHPELGPGDVATHIRAPGIFSDHVAKADDLAAAEVDQDAARRLGASPADLRVDHRARELLNWLNHIEERGSRRAVESDPA
jgi:GMP synthase (glutamine-hydrolysing)